VLSGRFVQNNVQGFRFGAILDISASRLVVSTTWL